MPEGPSILILKEQCQQFEKQKVLKVAGNTKESISVLQGDKIIALQTFGKNFLICFKKYFVKVHLMLFGSYRINDTKNSKARLSLIFKEGELNFYACSVKILQGKTDDYFDWSADVLNKKWSAAKALKKIQLKPEAYLCDVLLDQNIFAGLGNIIKNEVLFRLHLHPLNKIANTPASKLKAICKEARIYSQDFYRWKKKFTLKKHYQIYHQKKCKTCNSRVIAENLGNTNRKTYYCPRCQKLYKKKNPGTAPRD